VGYETAVADMAASRVAPPASSFLYLSRARGASAFSAACTACWTALVQCSIQIDNDLHDVSPELDTHGCRAPAATGLPYRGV
jgi:hypothetical protein